MSVAQTLHFSEEQLKRVSEHPQWKLLLHYKKNWKPGDRSEIDGGDFFISPVGNKNPLEELKATLAALGSSREFGILKQPAACAFKARYRFLSRELGFQVPKVSCEKWDAFLAGFNSPQTVSLVFSAAYTNNPASMFGHLFFKVKSKNSSDLLDVGVNFAASVPADENGLAFFYYGVFGGYEGHWSVQPYYEKLNEYSRAENRDLWEYELDLTPEETIFFLEHIWELETTSIFNYYFFDDNCAYQMGRVLEAIRPEWNLSAHKIYAIPGEMVKNFAQSPGVVRAIHFRPSLRKKLFQKYQVLSSEQKIQFFELVKGRSKPSEIKEAIVLESASSYFDYQRQLKKGILEDSEKKLWNEILIQRASLGSVTLPPLPEISRETRPDLGHDAYSLTAIFGNESLPDYEGYSFFGLKWRSAYHDLLNKDLGFKKYSEIQFPWVEVRYRPELKQWHFEELGGLKIVSLTPYSALDFHPSWKTTLAFQSVKDFGCLNCRHFVWEAGIGLSEEVFSEEHLFYQFVTMRSEFDEKLSRGYRLLPTIEAGWLSTFVEDWKFGLQGSYSRDISSSPLNNEFFRVGLSQSYSLQRNLDLRQKFELIYPNIQQRPAYSEIRLDLSFYFR